MSLPISFLHSSVMRKYPAENWKRLGQWVHDARLQAGYGETNTWAEVVGRSSRMLLGLERGEPVGAGTLQAVAEALAVAEWSIFARLSDPDGMASIGDMDTDDIQRLKAEYTAETGRPIEDIELIGTPLRELTDEELMAEVARRMRGGGRSVWRTEPEPSEDGPNLSAVAYTGPIEPPGEFD